MNITSNIASCFVMNPVNMFCCGLILERCAVNPDFTISLILDFSTISCMVPAECFYTFFRWSPQELKVGVVPFLFTCHENVQYGTVM